MNKENWYKVRKMKGNMSNWADQMLALEASSFIGELTDEDMSPSHKSKTEEPGEQVVLQ